MSRPKAKDRHEVLFRYVYNKLLHRHRSRWPDTQPLSLEAFKSLVTRPCEYCGFEGSNHIYDRRKDRGKNSQILTRTVLNINGVDRRDNSRGYEEDNCQCVCRYCNQAKMDRKEEFFLHWIAEVYHKTVRGTENDLDISE